MKSPESRERITGVGFDPAFSTPEQFTAAMKTEMSRMGKVIRDAGIRED
jgi:tripartite-type tricarboxylate transporter receptor subunit TctC